MSSAFPTRRTALSAIASACTAALLPGAALARTPARRGPPLARVEPISEAFFGETIVDPYRWMENPKDPQWEPFMRGQDAFARASLNAIPGRAALHQRVAALSGGTAVAYGVQSTGGRLFDQDALGAGHALARRELEVVGPGGPHLVEKAPACRLHAVGHCRATR